MLYDFGAGILRARGGSRRPFLILTASGGMNVLLNLFVVFPISWVVTTLLMWGAMLWERSRRNNTI